jgi:hypothetical protein
MYFISITVLINVKIFHDIGLYIWKIFPCIRILNSTTVNISLEFFNSFLYYHIFYLII